MIEYCSPTLAGIKSANLFGILYQDKYALEREVRKLNSSCNAKGVFAKILTNKSGRALIYVYRNNLYILPCLDYLREFSRYTLRIADL